MKLSFLRQIEIFRVVMASSSLAEASKRLLISQPAISRQIQALEAYVSVDLFDRRGHRLEPTTYARELFDRSGIPVEAIRDLQGYARSLRQHTQQSVRLSIMPMMAKLWLPAMLDRLLRTFPQVEFSVNVDSSAEVIAQIEKGEIDIGVALPLRPVGAERYAVLRSIPSVCIFPPDHRLASKASIDPRDLAEEPFLLLGPRSYTRRYIMAAFEEFGLRPRVRAEIEVEEVVTSLVASGAGVSVIDAYSAKVRSQSGTPIDFRPFKPDVNMEIHLFEAARRRADIPGAIFDVLVAMNASEDVPEAAEAVHGAQLP